MNELSSWNTLGPIFAIVLGASGTYLLLPHKHGLAKPAIAHWAGGAMAGLGLLLLASLWSAPGTVLTSLFFYAFSFCAIAAGLMMVTSRDPVYSALWFAAVVLATSGLFLLAGAQFLAAGTVIVYAGAIIVTFLFVIMLAQSEGQAMYDRAARSPMAATLTSFVLLWCLVYAAYCRPGTPARAGSKPSVAQLRPEPAAAIAERHQLRARSRDPAGASARRSRRPPGRRGRLLRTLSRRGTWPAWAARSTPTISSASRSPERFSSSPSWPPPPSPRPSRPCGPTLLNDPPDRRAS